MTKTSPSSAMTVRVPGKVMLSGEYAVLHGESALALTVDRFLDVAFEWGASEAGDVLLSSNLWTEQKTLKDAGAEPFAQAVRYGIEKTGRMPHKVTVTSDLDPRYGLGSSSALRLGICAGFRFQNEGWSEAVQAGQKDAYTLQFAHQTLASGYDICTQATGGLVSYLPASPWPGQVDAHAVPETFSDHLWVIGGGRGAPTGSVMQDTRTWLRQAHKDADLVRASARLTQALWAVGTSGHDQQAWTDVYAACGDHRRLFRGAPHEPLALLAACEALPGVDRDWSLKTTGAGGEDAILLMGPRGAVEPALKCFAERGWEPLPIHFTDKGAEVLCH